jgi:oligosaccharide repeat unit polymerase
MGITILSIWVISVFLLKTILNKNSSIVILVISWWFLWLYISTHSFGGIDVPSEETYFYFLSVLISVTVGALSFKVLKSVTIYSKYNQTENFGVNYKMENISKFLVKVNYYFIFPSLLFFLFKAVYVLMSIDSIAMFRAVAMGSDDERSKIFSSFLLQFYYSWFVMPIVMISMFVGFSEYAYRKGSQLLSISFIGLLMSSLISMGRGPIFMFLILYFILIGYQSRFKILTILRSKSMIRAGGILSLIIVITLIRTNGNSDLSTMFNIFVINYHTCGFAIFNHEYMDSASYLNTHTTYGMGSTGTFSYIFGLFYHLFDNNFNPIPEEIGRTLNDYKNLGTDEISGMPLLYNAFGTIMYSVYLDGGFVFSVIMGLIYGYYLTKHIYLTQYQVKNFYYSLTLVFLFIFIAFSSLFVPILSGNIILYFAYILILFKTNIAQLGLSKLNFKL